MTDLFLKGEIAALTAAVRVLIATHEHRPHMARATVDVMDKTLASIQEMGEVGDGFVAGWTATRNLIAKGLPMPDDGSDIYDYFRGR